jgi:imidazolonepropionase-like amidohydrolase
MKRVFRSPWVLAGTPFNSHCDNLGKLRCLLEVGFTSTEALIAVTKTGTQVLGLDNEIGTVSEGKVADLVVLRGKPLEDFESLLERNDVDMVMQGGNLVSTRL